MDVRLSLSRGETADLHDVDLALRAWQVEGEPLQLHPGDVGWGCRRGAAPTATALRAWRTSAESVDRADGRGRPGEGQDVVPADGPPRGRLVAVGFLDEPDLLRLALAPDVVADQTVARALAADLANPARGVLPEGEAYVEAPLGAALHDALAELGWQADEPWTPLRRGLSGPVEDPGIRVEVVDDARQHDWSSVLRAAFGNISALDHEEMRRRWQAMHEAPAARDSRSLVAYDDAGTPVAAATVWSAGPRRPGVLEPVGVHPDHRGHGYGRAIGVAAARALQELGSSSAIVCTPTSNVAAVATYASAGFEREPERRDRHRSA